jgi:hypothetical protein
MPDEQVTQGSAGPAKRKPKRGRGPNAAAEQLTVLPDLDERERNISPRRKAMGPQQPPQAGPAALANAQTPAPDVPATDPK